MIQVDVKGFNEAAKLLRMLPSSISTKVLQDGQRMALKPALNDMKNIAKVRVGSVTGKYHKSIGYKALRRSRYTVASLVGNRYGSLGAPHAALVESGTKKRYLKKERMVTFKNKSGEVITARVNNTGTMPAAQVISDAVDMNMSSVSQDFEMYVIKSLERTMKRYQKRYGK